MGKARSRTIAKIDRVQLRNRQPHVSIDDLVQMMEIELVLFGDRNGFRLRLQRDLNDAFWQGQVDLR